MHPQTHSAYNFFLLLLLGVGVLVFILFKPFVSPLILAVALAVVFYPVYTHMLRSVTNNRKTTAALLTLLIVVALIIVPLLFVGGLLFNEARELYVQSSLTAENASGIVTASVDRLERALQNIAPEITLDVRSYFEAILSWVLSNLTNLFSGFIYIIINMFIMLIALFFLLRDGDRFKQYIIAISPLANVYDESLLKKISTSINAVIKGSLIIALIQGIIASIGFALFYLPSPVIWGTVTAIAALVPGIGTAVVMIPAILYLFFAGTLGNAIGLLVWGIVAVGLIDNILTPILLNRGTNVHQALILISVLGGISFFGPIGFVAGPVIVSLFLALLELYPTLAHQQVDGTRPSA